MAFTAVGSWLGGFNATGSPTIALTNQAIGNLLIIEVQNQGGSTVWPSGLTGGGATWVQAGVKFSGTTKAMSGAVFFGTVTATGTQTAAVTWSGATPTAYTIYSGYEFHSSVGAWYFDKQAGLDSAGTNTWPSMIPAGAGEIYFGVGTDSVNAVAGSTTGFVYGAGADGNGDGAAYNLAYTSGVAPVWGDSTEDFGVMVLVAEGFPSVGLLPLRGVSSVPSLASAAATARSRLAGTTGTTHIYLTDGGTGTDALVAKAPWRNVQTPYPPAKQLYSGPVNQIIGADQVTVAVPLADGGAAAATLTISQPTALADGGTGADTLGTVVIPNPAMATLTENFSASSLDLTKWTGQYGTGTIYTQGSGQGTFTTSTTAGYAGFNSILYYNLTGSYASIQLVQAGSASLASLETYPVQLEVDGSNKLFWLINSSSGVLYIFAIQQVAGSNTVLYSAAYSSVSHQYFRIRELSGTTYWDTSADGVTWVNAASAANPFAVVALQYVPSVGTYATEASGTTVLVDNLNIFPGATAVPLADAGTETDALAIAQPTALADGGTESDALTTVSAVTLADGGTGSDTLALTQPTSLADAGTETDALTLTQSTALADGGTETDALAITQATALADTGTGTDTLSTVAAVALADAGTETDAFLLAGTAVPLPDAGSAVDVLTVAYYIGLADGGTETDALTAVAAVALADGAAAADSLSISQPTALADAGTGTDALTITQPTSLADAGTGTDALTVTQAAALAVVIQVPFPVIKPPPGPVSRIIGTATATLATPLPDAGTATDTLTTSSAVSLTDGGTGADTLALTQAVPLADAGTETDALAITQATPLADGGAAADTLAITQATPLPDSATGADTAAVTASVALTDAGTASDAVAAIGTLADSGTGTDALSLVATQPLADAGSGADTLVAQQPRLLADGGLGTDALAAGIGVALADGGTGSDAIGALLPIPLTDAGLGADTAGVRSTSVTTVIAAGTGSDTVTLQSTYALTDSGSCADTLAAQLVEQLEQALAPDQPWISPADGTSRMSDTPWISPADGTIRTADDPQIWTEGS